MMIDPILQSVSLTHLSPLSMALMMAGSADTPCSALEAGEEDEPAEHALHCSGSGTAVSPQPSRAG